MMQISGVHRMLGLHTDGLLLAFSVQNFFIGIPLFDTHKPFSVAGSWIVQGSMHQTNCAPLCSMTFVILPG